jgi:hypothetical protein
MEVQEIRKRLEEFEKTGILEIPPETTQHMFDVWACVFEDNIKGWEIIRMEQAERLIQESKKRCEDDIPALYRINASLAYACVKLFNPKEAHPPRFREAIERMFPLLVQKWKQAFHGKNEFLDRFNYYLERDSLSDYPKG